MSRSDDGSFQDASADLCKYTAFPTILYRYRQRTTDYMNRRSLLQSVSVGVVVVAGCLGNGGGFGADDESTGSDDESEDDGQVGAETLTESLESRNLDVLVATQDDETIVVEIQTTGDVDEDVRITAGAYATVSRDLERDLRVTVEDRGLREETFEIELEWAREFLDERITDQEYLDRIEDTRE